MSWIRIEVNTAELGRFLASLEQLAEFTRTESEMVASEVRRGILYNFEREAAPDGAKWDKLAPLTVWERRQGIDHRGVPFTVGAHNPILMRTGDLRASYTEESHPQHMQDVSTSASRTQISIGASNSPDTPRRIELLHEGSRLFNIPPRPWVGLAEPQKEKVYQLIFDIIDRKIRRL